MAVEQLTFMECGKPAVLRSPTITAATMTDLRSRPPPSSSPTSSTNTTSPLPTSSHTSGSSWLSSSSQQNATDTTTRSSSEARTTIPGSSTASRTTAWLGSLSSLGGVSVTRASMGSSTLPGSSTTAGVMSGTRLANSSTLWVSPVTTTPDENTPDEETPEKKTLETSTKCPVTVDASTSMGGAPSLGCSSFFRYIPRPSPVPVSQQAQWEKKIEEVDSTAHWSQWASYSPAHGVCEVPVNEELTNPIVGKCHSAPCAPGYGPDRLPLMFRIIDVASTLCLVGRSSYTPLPTMRLAANIPIRATQATGTTIATQTGSPRSTGEDSNRDYPPVTSAVFRRSALTAGLANVPPRRRSPTRDNIPPRARTAPTPRSFSESAGDRRSDKCHVSTHNLTQQCLRCPFCSQNCCKDSHRLLTTAQQLFNPSPCSLQLPNEPSPSSDNQPSWSSKPFYDGYYQLRDQSFTVPSEDQKPLVSQHQSRRSSSQPQSCPSTRDGMVTSRRVFTNAKYATNLPDGARVSGRRFLSRSPARSLPPFTRAASRARKASQPFRDSAYCSNNYNSLRITQEQQTPPPYGSVFYGRTFVGSPMWGGRVVQPSPSARRSTEGQRAPRIFRRSVSPHMMNCTPPHSAPPFAKRPSPQPFKHHKPFGSPEDTRPEPWTGSRNSAFRDSFFKGKSSHRQFSFGSWSQNAQWSWNEGQNNPSIFDSFNEERNQQPFRRRGFNLPWKMRMDLRDENTSFGFTFPRNQQTYRLSNQTIATVEPESSIRSWSHVRQFDDSFLGKYSEDDEEYLDEESMETATDEVCFRSWNRQGESRAENSISPTSKLSLQQNGFQQPWNEISVTQADMYWSRKAEGENQVYYNQGVQTDELLDYNKSSSSFQEDSSSSLLKQQSECLVSDSCLTPEVEFSMKDEQTDADESPNDLCERKAVNLSKQSTDQQMVFVSQQKYEKSSQYNDFLNHWPTQNKFEPPHSFQKDFSEDENCSNQESFTSCKEICTQSWNTPEAYLLSKKDVLDQSSYHSIVQKEIESSQQETHLKSWQQPFRFSLDTLRVPRQHVNVLQCNPFSRSGYMPFYNNWSQQGFESSRKDVQDTVDDSAVNISQDEDFVSLGEYTDGLQDKQFSSEENIAVTEGDIATEMPSNDWNVNSNEEYYSTDGGSTVDQRENKQQELDLTSENEFQFSEQVLQFNGNTEKCNGEDTLSSGLTKDENTFPEVTNDQQHNNNVCQGYRWNKWIVDQLSVEESSVTDWSNNEPIFQQQPQINFTPNEYNQPWNAKHNVNCSLPDEMYPASPSPLGNISDGSHVIMFSNEPNKAERLSVKVFSPEICSTSRNSFMQSAASVQRTSSRDQKYPSKRRSTGMDTFSHRSRFQVSRQSITNDYFSPKHRDGRRVYQIQSIRKPWKSQKNKNISTQHMSVPCVRQGINRNFQYQQLSSMKQFASPLFKSLTPPTPSALMKSIKEQYNTAAFSLGEGQLNDITSLAQGNGDLYPEPQSIRVGSEDAPKFEKVPILLCPTKVIPQSENVELRPAINSQIYPSSREMPVDTEHQPYPHLSLGDKVEVKNLRSFETESYIRQSEKEKLNIHPPENSETPCRESNKKALQTFGGGEEAVQNAEQNTEELFTQSSSAYNKDKESQIEGKSQLENEFKPYSITLHSDNDTSIKVPPFDFQQPSPKEYFVEYLKNHQENKNRFWFESISASQDSNKKANPENNLNADSTNNERKSPKECLKENQVAPQFWTDSFSPQNSEKELFTACSTISNEHSVTGSNCFREPWKRNDNKQGLVDKNLTSELNASLQEQNNLPPVEESPEMEEKKKTSSHRPFWRPRTFRSRPSSRTSPGEASVAERGLSAPRKPSANKWRSSRILAIKETLCQNVMDNKIEKSEIANNDKNAHTNQSAKGSIALMSSEKPLISSGKSIDELFRSQPWEDSQMSLSKNSDGSDTPLQSFSSNKESVSRSVVAAAVTAAVAIAVANENSAKSSKTTPTSSAGNNPTNCKVNDSLDMTHLSNTSMASYLTARSNLTDEVKDTSSAAAGDQAATIGSYHSVKRCNAPCGNTTSKTMESMSSKNTAANDHSDIGFPSRKNNMHLQEIPGRPGMQSFYCRIVKRGASRGPS